MTRSILIVDDDSTIRESLSEALTEQGIRVTVADDGTTALPLLEKESPDVVLCDVRMPQMNGLALLATLRERKPAIDVIMMTAYDDMGTVATAMRAGAVDFLVKPVGLSQLLAVTDRVFEDRQYRDRALRRGDDKGDLHESNPIIGHDPRMIAIYKLVGQAAATSATVLIRGESGTGKELVARAIHSHSNHAKEPFVPVNCAALPSTLLESELFGHVRGAFTGAHEARKGRFAVAGRGAIFLDEIGDTSLELQTKLLRVVQDREYQPVGSEKTEHSEARVIAATHQDLERMIVERRFREDLYYRLRVVEIMIPPLRERVGDIPVLAQHLVRSGAASLGTSTPVISQQAIDSLVAYSWPGNVRELENCLKRAVVIASGSVIRREHLLLGNARKNDAASQGMSSLDEVEREQVLRVLNATGNHKGRAAAILGVSRPRLRRLMEKYGIDG